MSSNSCQYLAPNGEKSLLYQQLTARFGDERADFLWNKIRTPEWQNQHGWWTTVDEGTQSSVELNDQGEPSLKTVMETENLEAESPVDNPVITINIADPTDPLSLNMMGTGAPTMTFQFGTAEGQGSVVSLEHLLLIQSIGFVRGMDDQSVANLLGTVLNQQHQISHGQILTSLAASPNFDTEAWNLYLPQVLFDSLYAMSLSSPAFKEALISSWGSELTVSGLTGPLAEIEPLITEAYKNVRTYVYEGGATSYTKEVKVSLTELGRNVTIKKHNGEYMAPIEYSEALNSVAHIAQVVLSEPGADKITKEVLQQEVIGRLTTAQTYFTKVAAGARDRKYNTSAEDAAAYVANLNMLLEKDPKGKQLALVLLNKALDLPQMRGFGLTKEKVATLAENDGVVVNGEKNAKQFDKPVYSIPPQNTAGMRVKAWLSTIPELLVKPMKAKAISIPINLQSQRALLINDDRIGKQLGKLDMVESDENQARWPVSYYRDAYRKLIIRDGEQLIKDIGLQEGEYGELKVSTNKGTTRTFIVQSIGYVSKTDEGLEKAFEFNQVTKEGSYMAYQIIDEYRPGYALGVNKLNMFGTPYSVNFNRLFQQLLSKISVLPEINERTIISTLESDPNPTFRTVANRLSSKLYGRMNGADRGLLHDFVSAMSQTNVSMKRVLIRSIQNDEGGYAGMSIVPVNSNRNSDFNVLQREWKANQKFHPVSTQLKDGTIVMDGVKLAELQIKVRAYYNSITELNPDGRRFNKTITSEQRQQGIELIDEVLGAHGIVLPPGGSEALFSNNHIYARRNKAFGKSVYALFGFNDKLEPTGVISALTSTNGKNPLEQYSSITNILAKIYLDLDRLSFSRSFRNINNDVVWPHTMPSFLTDAVKNINSESGQFLSNHKMDPLHSLNPYVSSKEGVDKIRQLQLHVEDGINRGDRLGLKGRERGSMSKTDQDLFSLANFFNGFKGTAIFTSFTHSDKPTTYLFELPIDRVAEQAWELRGDEVVLRPYMAVRLLELARMEYSRIVNGTTPGDKLWLIMPDMSFSGMTEMVKGGYITEEQRNLFYDLNGNMRADFMSGTNVGVLINSVMPAIAKRMTDRQYNEWIKNGTISYAKNGDQRVLLMDSSVTVNYSAGKISTLLSEAEQARIVNQMALYDYTLHRYLFNSQIGTLLFGDPALAYQPKWANYNAEKLTQAIKINYGKRLAGPIAPGRKPSIEAYDRPVARTLVINDPVVELKELKVKADSIADAQEFMTVREWLQNQRATGAITEQLYQEMIQVVNAGEQSGWYEFTEPSHKGVIRQIEKWVSYSQRVDQNGRVRYDYVKSSTMVLYPPSIGNLNKLRLLMEAKGDPDRRIDRAHMVSARKLGYDGRAVDLFDNDGNITTELSYENVLPAVEVIDRNNMYIQQYVPYDETKDEISVVTQANKNILDLLPTLITTPIVLPYSKQSFSARELVRKKEQTVKAIIKTQVAKTLEKFRAEGEVEGTRKEVNEGLLREAMVETARMLNYTEVQIASLLHKSGELFTIPILYNNSYNKLQSLLMNKINKALKIYVPGTSYVQSTSAGAQVDSEFLRNKTGIIYAEGFDPSQRLSSMIKNKEGVIRAQIMVPWNFRDKNGNLIDINKFTKEVDGRRVIDNEKLPPQLRSIIGMRIPNQSHNSMMSFEIVGFLPQEEGSRAVVPADIARQMGSDFDVDKLYSYMYAHKYENGMLTVDNDGINAFRNEYIELFEAVLTHPEMYDKVMTSIDTPYLKEAQAEFPPVPWSGSMMEGAYQDREFMDQKEGKDLVGVFAKAKTFEPITQRASLPLARWVITPKADGGTEMALERVSFALFSRVTPEGDVAPLKYTKIGGVGYTFIDGKKVYKGDLISVLLGESVDYSKNRTLDNTNINLQTASMVSALLFLQDQTQIANVKEIVAFLKQPVVQRYLELRGSTSIMQPMLADKQIFTQIANELSTETDQVLWFDQDLGSAQQADVTGINPYTYEEYLQGSKADYNNLSSSERDMQVSVLKAMVALMEVGKSLQTLQSRMDVDVQGLGKDPYVASEYLAQAKKLESGTMSTKIGFDNVQELLFEDRRTPYPRGNERAEQIANYKDATEKHAYNMMAKGMFRAMIDPIFPIDAVRASALKLQSMLGYTMEDELTPETFAAVTEGIRAYVTATGIPNIQQERVRLTTPTMYNTLFKLKNRYPTNEFLKGLAVANADFRKITDPVIIRYAGYDFDDVSNAAVYNDFATSVTSPDIELRQFMRDMILLEFVTGNTQDNSSFARYIHPEIYEKFGLTDLYRLAHMEQKSNSEGEWAQSVQDMYPQIVQHNPQLVKQVPVALLGTYAGAREIDLTDALTGDNTNEDLRRILVNDNKRVVGYFRIELGGKTYLYKVRNNARGVFGAGPIKYDLVPLLGNNFMAEYGSASSILPENAHTASYITVRVDAPYHPQLPAEMPKTFEQIFTSATQQENATDADLALLRNIADNTTIPDGPTRTIARILSKLPVSNYTEKPLKISDKSHPKGDLPAWFSGGDVNTIGLDLNELKKGRHAKVRLEEYYVHESLHARLNNALDKADDGLKTRIDQLIDLTLRRNEAAGNPIDFNGVLGKLSDTGRRYEFMVLSITDENTRKFLAEQTIEGSGIRQSTNLLQKIFEFFFDLFQSVFGLSDIDSYSLLSEVMILNERLLNNEQYNYTSTDITVGGINYKVWTSDGEVRGVTFADGKGLYTVHKFGQSITAVENAVVNAYQNSLGTTVFDGVSYPFVDIFNSTNTGPFNLGEFQMNEGQERALREVTTELSRIMTSDPETDPARRSWFLTGAGGTGKTTVLKKIVAHLAKKHGFDMDSVVFMGPSNTAKMELASALGVQQSEVRTVASVIGKRPTSRVIFDGNRVSNEFEYADLVKLKGTPKLIIVDEASMLSNDDAIKVLKLSKEVPILFVGDKDQLPKTEENQRPEEADELSWPIRTLSPIGRMSVLTENVRAKYADLAHVIAYVRAAVSKVDGGKTMSVSPGVKQVLNSEHVTYTTTINDFLAAYMDKFNAADIYNQVILTYTNKARKKLNDDIRNLRYSVDAETYRRLPGDHLTHEGGVLFATDTDSIESLGVPYKHMRLTVVANRGRQTIEHSYQKGQGENAQIVTIVLPDMEMIEVEVPSRFRIEGTTGRALIGEIPERAGFDLEMYRMINGDKDLRMKSLYDTLSSGGQITIPARLDWIRYMLSLNGFPSTTGDLVFDGKKMTKREIYRLNEILKYVSDAHRNGLDHGYASTVHSAQGATFKNVFVHEQNIRIVSAPTAANKVRALYTAYSRAAETLTIFHPDFVVEGYHPTASGFAEVKNTLGVPENADVRISTEYDRKAYKEAQQMADTNMEEPSAFSRISKTGERQGEIKGTPKENLIEMLSNLRDEYSSKIIEGSALLNRSTIEMYRQQRKILDTYINNISTDVDLSRAVPLAQRQLDWVKAKLIEGTSGSFVSISWHDINLMYEIANTWSGITRKLFFAEIAGNTNPDRQLLAGIEETATELFNQVVNTMDDLIVNAYDRTRGSSFRSSYSERGKLGGLWLRSLSNASDPVVARVNNMIYYEMIKRDQEIREKTKKMEELKKRAEELGGLDTVWKELTRQTIVGGNHHWGMLSNYSAGYYDSMNTLYAKLWSGKRNAEKRAVGPEELSQLLDQIVNQYFYQRNLMQAHVNPTIFFNEDGSRRNGPDVDAEIAFLNENTDGDAERLIQLAEEKYNNWLATYEAYKNEIEEDLDKGRIATCQAADEMLADFKKLYDPANYFTGQTAEGWDKIDSTRFVISAPRSKIGGKTTGYYDQRYKALMAATDERSVKLKEWMKDYKAMIAEARESLPEMYHHRIHDGFIPAIHKDKMQGYSNLYNSVVNDSLPQPNDLTAEAWEENLMYGKTIPVRFVQNSRGVVSPEDYDSYSHDLVRTLELFVGMATHYKHANHIYEQAKTFDSLLQETDRLRRSYGMDGISQTLSAWEFATNKQLFQVPTQLEIPVGQPVRFLSPALINKYKREYDALREELYGLQAEKAAIAQSAINNMEELGAWLNKDSDINTRVSEIEVRMKEIEEKFPQKTFYVSKFADKMIKLQQMQSFAFNPISGTVNLLLGMLQGNQYAAGEMRRDDGSLVAFTQKTYNSAMRSMLAAIASNKKSLYNRVFAFMDAGNMMGEVKDTWHGNTNIKSYRKWWQGDYLNPFILMQKGDLMVRSVVTYAFMLDQELDGPNGKVRLYDLVQDNGSLKPGYEEQFAKQVGRLQRIMEPIVGVTDARKSILAKKTFLGRLVGQFRLSWIPEGAHSRFGAEQYDDILDVKTRGRYHTYADLGFIGSLKMLGRLAIARSIPGMRNFEESGGILLKKTGTKLSESEMDKANMRRNYKEAVWLSRILLMTALLTYLRDDEDDEDKRSYYLLGLNILFRNYQDTVFFFNPDEANTLLRSGIPSATVVTNFLKFLKATGKYTWSEVTGENDYELEDWIYRFTNNSVILPQMSVINKIRTMTTRDISDYSR